MPFKKLSLALVVSSISLLSACTDDDKKKVFTTDSAAIISTVAFNYSGSDIQIVDLSSGDYAVSSGLLPSDQSDKTVAGGNKSFYHINKTDDKISNFTLDDTSVAKYTFSTLDDSEESGSNPYTIVELNNKKAFVVRYGLDKVWVVNPSAKSEAEFKIGEIDLSAYNDGGNDPEAFGAIITDKKLFIGMQRLDGYSRVRSGTIAVFNTGDLSEVDTNTNIETNGIDLESRNPVVMTYQADVGIVVASIDNYNDGVSFQSAIESINPATFTTKNLVNDGDDEESNLYGSFSHVTIIDGSNGYFVGYQGWKNNNLYHFNPTTGAVTGIVEGFSATNITTLNTDKSGFTWVGIGDAADPRIHVLAADQSEEAEISLIQNPNAIAFVTKTVTQ